MRPAVQMLRLGRLGWLGAGGVAALLPALLALLPGVSANYILYVINLGLVMGVAAVGLNLLTGVAGQISLGQAAFMAVGAYTSAWLTGQVGAPFVVGWLAAIAVTTGLGAGLGLVALRLSGPYLAVATLAFGVAVVQLLVYFDGVTGGAAGLKVAPAALGPLVLASDARFYPLALAACALAVLLGRRVTAAALGRAWTALREDEGAAAVMGVNIAYHKTLAFALSAGYAGAAGSLFAALVGFITPENFTLALSIQLLTMIVVGGLASLGGSVVGALVITALPIWLSTAPGLPKNLSLGVFGLLMILVILGQPRGLAGLRLGETRGRDTNDGHASEPRP